MLLQYASKRDLQAHALSSENYQRYSLGYGRSRPKHVVSEGLMILADDKRPAANRHIGFRLHALQRHIRDEYDVHILFSMLAEEWVVAK
jgi:hypothetical protein